VLDVFNFVFKFLSKIIKLEHNLHYAQFRQIPNMLPCITTSRPAMRKINIKMSKMPKLHIKVTKSDIYLKLYYLVVFIGYMKMLTNDK